MIEQVKGLQEPVIGFRVHGKVKVEDYRQVLEPVLEKTLERWPKVRTLFVLSKDFEGFTLGALWEDARVGFDHFRDWDRIAIVGDNSKIGFLVNFFSVIIPGQMRFFPLEDEELARDWLKTWD